MLLLQYCHFISYADVIIVYNSQIIHHAYKSVAYPSCRIANNSDDIYIINLEVTCYNIIRITYDLLL